jgi:hypothetical protein
MHYLVELRDWYMSLPPDMKFFFAMPFLIAAVVLLRDAFRRKS